MKQIAPNCQEDKLWVWASVSYHSPPRRHSSRPQSLIERARADGDLVIEIRTQCGYFNQHWLLYGGRKEPAIHLQSLRWRWRSGSSTGCDRGANGSVLTADGYWDLCWPSKTIRYLWCWMQMELMLLWKFHITEHTYRWVFQVNTISY